VARPAQGQALVSSRQQPRPHPQQPQQPHPQHPQPPPQQQQQELPGGGAMAGEAMFISG